MLSAGFGLSIELAGVLHIAIVRRWMVMIGNRDPGNLTRIAVRGRATLAIYAGGIRPLDVFFVQFSLK